MELRKFQLSATITKIWLDFRTLAEKKSWEGRKKERKRAKKKEKKRDERGEGWWMGMEGKEERKKGKQNRVKELTLVSETTVSSLLPPYLTTASVTAIPGSIAQASPPGYLKAFNITIETYSGF